MTEPPLPDPSQALLASRISLPGAHDWHADDDNAGHHHGLVSINEAPYVVALYWQSRRAAKTVHVGTYKLNLRSLVRAGFAAAKPGNKVRLRFARALDGVVSIQANDSSPALSIGYAHF